jgi:hypothetical protein
MEFAPITKPVLTAEFCTDIKRMEYVHVWEKVDVLNHAEVKKFVQENKLTICKKKEARFLLILGMKDADSGCWIIPYHKNYWIK